MITRWIFDVESFPNLFTCTISEYSSAETKTFEISERKDDRKDTIKLFRGNDVRFIGYNCRYYDNILIESLLRSPNSSAYDLYVLSSMVFNRANEEVTKRYKYPSFMYTDLMLALFSKNHRVSLKQLQITLGWPNVMECPIPYDVPVKLEDIDEVIRYNINDTLSTRALAHRMSDRLNLRLNVQREYGMECMSKDDVALGVDLLRKLHSLRTNTPEAVLRDMRSPRPVIDLKECISDRVKFKSDRFDELLNILRSTKIKKTKDAFDLTVYYGGVLHRYGTGGIHSDDPAGIVKPEDGYKLMDADVTSLYPSLMIKYGFYPEHLGEVFIDIYREIRDKRVKAKRDGDAVTANTLKLSLNGTFGNLIQEYSWLYDPKAAMSVTINGQLFISMLSERLTDAGFEVISLNTDGIIALVKDNEVERYRQVCMEWELETGLNLEYNEYDKLIRKDVNNYIAVYKQGGYKLKGFFDYRIELGKGYKHPIVPYALVRHYVDGADVLSVIHGETDIHKFCMTQRADKKFTMEWNGKEVQHTNRYYASKRGAYLYKTRMSGGEKRSIHVLRDSPVMLANVIDDTMDISSYGINYEYYERQCRDITEVIEPAQMELFS
jgi:hypothetical protein